MITNDSSDHEMARKTLMVICGVVNGPVLLDKKQCFVKNLKSSKILIKVAFLHLQFAYVCDLAHVKIVCDHNKAFILVLLHTYLHT